MTPRPVHRWKSLWLGLLILTFLIWAWARSRSHDDYIGFQPRARPFYYLISGEGYLFLHINSLSGGGPTNAFVHGSEPTSTVAPWFPEPIRNQDAGDSRYIISTYGIAHWLLIILYFPTWASFLLFRAYRLRHLTASPP